MNQTTGLVNILSSVLLRVEFCNKDMYNAKHVISCPVRSIRLLLEGRQRLEKAKVHVDDIERVASDAQAKQRSHSAFSRSWSSASAADHMLFTLSPALKRMHITYTHT